MVHCNGYYAVIGISIIRNRISYNGISITIHQFSCYDLFKFLAAAFWWLLGLILLAVFLFDCFLAALFHHHRCGDVVRSFFYGSLLVHLCLVAGVCCLNSGIRISLFHLSKILIPDLFWLLCILLIFGLAPSNSRASIHFWVDSQPNLFSLRCFSHLSCWWLLLLLLLVLIVGSSPSTLSIVGSSPSTLSFVGSSPSTISVVGSSPSTLSS